MDSDEDNLAEEIQKHVSVKKISVWKGGTRIKKTQDDMYSERTQTDAVLNPTSQEAVGDMENQSTLTEVLRERVRGKLKSLKVECSINVEGSSSFPLCLKQLRKKSYAKYGTPNETSLDEGFTFFTSSIEEHPKLKETDQESEMNSSKDSRQNLCDLNEQIPLLGQVKEVLLPELLEVKPPENEWSNLDKKKHLESLFVPSSSPVVQNYQLPINMLPRLLEDEGFYVPRKPSVSRKTYHRMENRLLQQAELRALINATKVAESNLETSQLSTKTLQDYRSQIRNTRKLHDMEHQRDTSLKQNMLKVWKQIKSIRKQQGFTSTNVKLQFQKMMMKDLESDEYTSKKAEEAEQEIWQEREENDNRLSNTFSANWKTKVLKVFKNTKCLYCGKMNEISTVFLYYMWFLIFTDIFMSS